MYPSEWNGSQDKAVESGTATYKIDGETFSLRLDCFKDYQMIGLMLTRADQQGKGWAALALQDAVTRALRDRILQFAPETYNAQVQRRRAAASAETAG